ncbi:MAG TPA: hypothetical protein DHW82_11175 [Spirochaetia bacterium]|nr:hypothetical protein [Spirochaetia bacterium]
MDQNEILKELNSRLTPKRYKHSLHVAEKAVDLALSHNLDIEITEQAALLHDIAKDLSLDESKKKAEEYKIVLSEEELFNTGLIHSKIGKEILEKELKITHPEILNTVLHHTTGYPGMSDIELAVYVADYLDPNKKLKNYELIAKISRKNLYQASILVSVAKLDYVIHSLKTVNINSILFYNWLLTKRA